MDQMRMQMEAMMKRLELQQQIIDQLTKQKQPERTKMEAMSKKLQLQQQIIDKLTKQKKAEPLNKEFSQKERLEKAKIQQSQLAQLNKRQMLIKQQERQQFIKQQEREQFIKQRERQQLVKLRERQQEISKQAQLKMLSLIYENSKQQKEPRQYQGPLQWTKVCDINPGDQNLNLKVKIISGRTVAGKAKVLLGDETGVVNGFIWPNQYNIVGNSIVIFDAESVIYDGHIQIQNKKNGRVEKARKPIGKVDRSNNISQMLCC